MSAEKSERRTKASSSLPSMALNEDTSCCNSKGTGPSGMRSLSDLADTEVAICVTCRKGRSPLLATTQPSPALTRVLTIRPIQNQRCKVSKKDMCWVTSRTSSKVSGSLWAEAATEAVIPRYIRCSPRHSHSVPAG